MGSDASPVPATTQANQCPSPAASDAKVMPQRFEASQALSWARLQGGLAVRGRKWTGRGEGLRAAAPHKSWRNNNQRPHCSGGY